LSLRVLRRFPRARVVAVDYDPVVLAIGRGALGTVGGRLTWVDARLGHPSFLRALPPGKFDAAVSTTALHWLTPRSLGHLYADLARRLRAGGLFLDGDRLAWGPECPTFDRFAERIRHRHHRGYGSALGLRAWERWWSEAARVPALAEAFLEHDRRRAGHPEVRDAPLGTHLRALRRAGFREVGVLWQNQEDRVLAAVR
jgi:SAM-dependent methyltransferase